MNLNSVSKRERQANITLLARIGVWRLELLAALKKTATQDLNEQTNGQQQKEDADMVVVDCLSDVIDGVQYQQQIQTHTNDTCLSVICYDQTNGYIVWCQTCRLVYSFHGNKGPNLEMWERHVSSGFHKERCTKRDMIKSFTSHWERAQLEAFTQPFVGKKCYLKSWTKKGQNDKQKGERPQYFYAKPLGAEHIYKVSGGDFLVCDLCAEKLGQGNDVCQHLQSFSHVVNYMHHRYPKFALTLGGKSDAAVQRFLIERFLEPKMPNVTYPPNTQQTERLKKELNDLLKQEVPDSLLPVLETALSQEENEKRFLQAHLLYDDTFFFSCNKFSYCGFLVPLPRSQLHSLDVRWCEAINNHHHLARERCLTILQHEMHAFIQNSTCPSLDEHKITGTEGPGSWVIVDDGYYFNGPIYGMRLICKIQMLYNHPLGFKEQFICKCCFKYIAGDTQELNLHVRSLGHLMELLKRYDLRFALDLLKSNLETRLEMIEAYFSNPQVIPAHGERDEQHWLRKPKNNQIQCYNIPVMALVKDQEAYFPANLPNYERKTLSEERAQLFTQMLNSGTCSRQIPCPQVCSGPEPIVGLEFVIMVEWEQTKYAPVYLCCLCHQLFKNLRPHLISNSHRLAYLVRRGRDVSVLTDFWRETPPHAHQILEGMIKHRLEKEEPRKHANITRVLLFKLPANDATRLLPDLTGAEKPRKIRARPSKTAEKVDEIGPESTKEPVSVAENKTQQQEQIFVAVEDFVEEKSNTNTEPAESATDTGVKRVYVSGSGLCAASLERSFGLCGNIITVSVAESKSSASIDFETSAAAAKAVKMNGHVLNRLLNRLGAPLEVSLATVGEPLISDLSPDLPQQQIEKSWDEYQKSHQQGFTVIEDELLTLDQTEPAPHPSDAQSDENTMQITDVQKSDQPECIVIEEEMLTIEKESTSVPPEIEPEQEAQIKVEPSVITLEPENMEDVCGEKEPESGPRVENQTVTEEETANLDSSVVCDDDGSVLVAMWQALLGDDVTLPNVSVLQSRPDMAVVARNLDHCVLRCNACVRVVSVPANQMTLLEQFWDRHEGTEHHKTHSVARELYRNYVRTIRDSPWPAIEKIWGSDTMVGDWVRNGGKYYHNGDKLMGEDLVIKRVEYIYDGFKTHCINDFICKLCAETFVSSELGGHMRSLEHIVNSLHLENWRVASEILNIGHSNTVDILRCIDRHLLGCNYDKKQQKVCYVDLFKLIGQQEEAVVKHGLTKDSRRALKARAGYKLLKNILTLDTRPISHSPVDVRLNKCDPSTAGAYFVVQMRWQEDKLPVVYVCRCCCWVGNPKQLVTHLLTYEHGQAHGALVRNCAKTIEHLTKYDQTRRRNRLAQCRGQLRVTRELSQSLTANNVRLCSDIFPSTYSPSEQPAKQQPEGAESRAESKTQQKQNTSPEIPPGPQEVPPVPAPIPLSHVQIDQRRPPFNRNHNESLKDLVGRFGVEVVTVNDQEEAALLFCQTCHESFTWKTHNLSVWPRYFEKYHCDTDSHRRALRKQDEFRFIPEFILPDSSSIQVTTPPELLSGGAWSSNSEYYNRLNVGTDYLIERQEGEHSDVYCLLCFKEIQAEQFDVTRHVRSKEHITLYLHKHHAEFLNDLPQKKRLLKIDAKLRRLKIGSDEGGIGDGPIRIYNPTVGILNRQHTPEGQEPQWCSKHRLTQLVKMVSSDHVEGVTSSVDSSLLACTESLVGVEFVFELLQGQGNCCYLCRLCPSLLPQQQILLHLLSPLHIMNYFKKYYPLYWQEVDEIYSRGFKPEAMDLMKKHARQVERDLGGGKMLDKRLTFKLMSTTVMRRALPALWPKAVEEENAEQFSWLGTERRAVEERWQGQGTAHAPQEPVPQPPNPPQQLAKSPEQLQPWWWSESRKQFVSAEQPATATTALDDPKQRHELKVALEKAISATSSKPTAPPTPAAPPPPKHPVITGSDSDLPQIKRVKCLAQLLESGLEPINGTVASVQHRLDQKLLLGVDHVAEVCSSNFPTCAWRSYLCRLCASWESRAEIVTHLCSPTHKQASAQANIDLPSKTIQWRLKARVDATYLASFWPDFSLVDEAPSADSPESVIYLDAEETIAAHGGPTSNKSGGHKRAADQLGEQPHSKRQRSDSSSTIDDQQRRVEEYMASIKSLPLEEQASKLNSFIQSLMEEKAAAVAEISPLESLEKGPEATDSQVPKPPEEFEPWWWTRDIQPGYADLDNPDLGRSWDERADEFLQKIAQNKSYEKPKKKKRKKEKSPDGEAEGGKEDIRSALHKQLESIVGRQQQSLKKPNMADVLETLTKSKQAAAAPNALQKLLAANPRPDLSEIIDTFTKNKEPEAVSAQPSTSTAKAGLNNEQMLLKMVVEERERQKEHDEQQQALMDLLANKLLKKKSKEGKHKKGKSKKLSKVQQKLEKLAAEMEPPKDRTPSREESPVPESSKSTAATSREQTPASDTSSAPKKSNVKWDSIKDALESLKNIATKPLKEVPASQIVTAQAMGENWRNALASTEVTAESDYQEPTPLPNPAMVLQPGSWARNKTTEQQAECMPEPVSEPALQSHCLPLAHQQTLQLSTREIGSISSTAKSDHGNKDKDTTGKQMEKAASKQQRSLGVGNVPLKVLSCVPRCEMDGPLANLKPKEPEKKPEPPQPEQPTSTFALPQTTVPNQDVFMQTPGVHQAAAMMQQYPSVSMSMNYQVPSYMQQQTIPSYLAQCMQVPPPPVNYRPQQYQTQYYPPQLPYNPYPPQQQQQQQQQYAATQPPPPAPAVSHRTPIPAATSSSIERLRTQSQQHPHSVRPAAPLPPPSQPAATGAAPLEPGEKRKRKRKPKFKKPNDPRTQQDRQLLPVGITQQQQHQTGEGSYTMDMQQTPSGSGSGSGQSQGQYAQVDYRQYQAAPRTETEQRYQQYMEQWQQWYAGAYGGAGGYNATQ